MTHKLTKEQLQDAVTGSTSTRQVLLALGLSAKGGNNAMIKRKCIDFGISIAHFNRKSQKGRPKRLRRDISEYLCNDQAISSFRLRNRLIREGILEHKCSHCGLSEWLGVLIPIELDHIDGNSENNSLGNLRLLCPNCHALTPTYRGKNKKKVVPETGIEPV